MGGRATAKKSKQGDKTRRKSQEQVPSHAYLCTKCEVGVEEDQDSIECGFCKGWCHKSCSKLSDEKFRFLVRGGRKFCGHVKIVGKRTNRKINQGWKQKLTT
jgi:hypothetical protein